MQVKDIMQKEVISLSPDTNTLEALKILLERRISGLPVIDKNDRLCGMLTEKEILRVVLPGYIEQVGKMIYTGYDKIIKKMQGLKELTVKDVMRKEVVTIAPEISLAEVARLMLTKKIRRIPVIKEGKVVGIIAREDVVKTVFKDAGVI